MPAILISLFKGVVIHLATKYAAELVVKHTISALKKAAADTASTIDDDVVAAIEKEQQYIVSSINGKING